MNTLSLNLSPSWTLGQKPHLVPHIVLYLISLAINLQLLLPEESFWYNRDFLSFTIFTAYLSQGLP